MLTAIKGSGPEKEKTEKEGRRKRRMSTQNLRSSNTANKLRFYRMVVSTKEKGWDGNGRDAMESTLYQPVSQTDLQG